MAIANTQEWKKKKKKHSIVGENSQKGSLYLESADNQAGIRHKNNTKSVIYLLSSEKHIIFALQKQSNGATIFAVKHLRL